MRPEHGVRFELRLEAEGEEGARFHLQAQLSEASFEGQARVSGDGTLTFDWASEPPEWCVQAVRAQLRLLLRDRKARGGYPRRVARWRPAPEGERTA